MNKVKRFYVILSFVLIVCNSNAYTLAGIVRDVDDVAIDYCSVVLLRSDSTFYKGVISGDNGQFTFADIPANRYILRFSHIDYSQYSKTMVIDRDSSIQITLTSSINSLKEITVTAHKPLFNMRSSNIIANVNGTSLGDLGTADDVVRHMPGVIDVDGAISVFGKSGSPIIYINGRRLNDVTELERLQSNDIETVELINNPGAQYDASGKAVIIVKTRRKLKGWGASLMGRLSQGSHLNDGENVSLAYSKGGIDIFGSYYHGHNKSKTTEDNDYNMPAYGDMNYQVNNPYYYSYFTHQISAGFNWSISPVHTFGLQYQYNTLRAENTGGMSSISSIGGVPYDNFISTASIKEKPYSHLLNGFYNATISDKLSFHVDFDYYKSNRYRSQITQEKSMQYDRKVSTLSTSDFNLYAGKAYLTYKIGASVLQVGGEHNEVKGDAMLVNDGNDIANNDATNKEVKTAVFVTYNARIGKFDASAGLRYEYNIESNANNTDTYMRRKYQGLYPNLSLSTQIKDVTLNLDLSKKVSRPSFDEMNDNVVYVNPFILQEGNPDLKEVYSYNANLQASYKHISVSLGYVYEDNPIVFVNEFDETTKSILMHTINYKKYQGLNLLINYNTKIGFWQPNYSLGLTQPFFSYLYNGTYHHNNHFGFSLYAYNDIDLGKGFTASLNYVLQGHSVIYTMDSKGYNRFDVGLRKALFNGKLMVTLDMRDVFNGVKENYILNYDKVAFTQAKKRETRFVVLTLNLKLSNYKKKYEGEHAAGDDINRM